jgi:ribulose-phosphate 3-epimerase
VAVLKKEIVARGLSVDIQVDGGITVENASYATSNGANILVAGSSVFKYDDRKKAIDSLR